MIILSWFSVDFPVKIQNERNTAILFAVYDLEKVAWLTIRKRAAQTLLSWCLLNRYISPTAVITFVTFFRTVTIATFMYFRLQRIHMNIIRQTAIWGITIRKFWVRDPAVIQYYIRFLKERTWNTENEMGKNENKNDNII